MVSLIGANTAAAAAAAATKVSSTLCWGIDLMEAENEGMHSKPQHLGDWGRRTINFRPDWGTLPAPRVGGNWKELLSRVLGVAVSLPHCRLWLCSDSLPQGNCSGEPEEQHLCQPTKVNTGSGSHGWHTLMILSENTGTLSLYSSSLKPWPWCDHEGNKGQTTEEHSPSS